MNKTAKVRSCTVDEELLPKSQYLVKGGRHACTGWPSQHASPVPIHEVCVCNAVRAASLGLHP